VPVISNGQPDSYIGPVSPESPDTEPFFASDYFEALYDYA
jgi:hypothetical protein